MSELSDWCVNQICSRAGSGERHLQMVEMLPNLIGSGLSGERVFQIFRGMYDDDVDDEEILKVISWGLGKAFTPPVKRSNGNGHEQKPKRPSKSVRLSDSQLTSNAQKFVREFRCDEADLWHSSPIRPSHNWQEDASVLLSQLFEPDEFVCINTGFRLVTNASGEEKAQIVGAGATRRVREWLEYFAERRVPQSEAGAWMRINPVTEYGSGKYGAHEDLDVTAWRFLLVEMDKIELQFAVVARLALPIAALVTSGGKSLQAWVRLDCSNLKEFSSVAPRILEAGAPFGIDRANKNASRYCRIPGVSRQIGALPFASLDDVGQQRLFFLNPQPGNGPIFPP